MTGMSATVGNRPGESDGPFPGALEVLNAPADGSPRLLEDSAILRERLYKDIASTNPQAIVFLDTCYLDNKRTDS